MQCQIIFSVSTETFEAGSARCETLPDALARLTACPLESIAIADMQNPPGGLTLTLPAYAFERLLTAGQAGDSAFEGLGIEQIKEVITQPHNFENIRRMLGKMFGPDELRQFCQKHFPAAYEQMPPDVNKAAMIDTLLEHARQTNRVPHILVFTQKHNAAVHKRYEPYFRIPRIFSYQHQKAAQRHTPRSPLAPRFFNLGHGELVKSAAAGIGVAAALTFLLQRVLMIPIDDQNAAQVIQLLWGTTAFIAIVVARTAVWGAHYKRGKLLAIISVASYWLGMILGNTLVYFSNIAVVFQSDLGGLVQPYFLRAALIFGFRMTVSPLFSFGAPLIVLVLGTYFAYRYAR